MRILTLGDSWTFGVGSSDPGTMSWPAQMARKYEVEVVNLARAGSSNQRAARIGIEELCRDTTYDHVILPLAPASRTEILKLGKYLQVWPGLKSGSLSPEDMLFTEFWHPWGDVQNTIMLCFYFIHSIQALGIPLYITGLSLTPSKYKNELNWIMNYKNDNDFRSLGIPLEELNIGVKDLDRKLRSLKAIHLANLRLQPDYFNDVVYDYFCLSKTQEKYEYSYTEFRGHPDNNGYTALADYFAGKIGLNSNS